eukprot:5440724-Alexandrium_andersonii.AAC.1
MGAAVVGGLRILLPTPRLGRPCPCRPEVSGSPGVRCYMRPRAGWARAGPPVSATRSHSRTSSWPPGVVIVAYAP